MFIIGMHHIRICTHTPWKQWSDCMNEFALLVCHNIIWDHHCWCSLQTVKSATAQSLGLYESLSGAYAVELQRLEQLWNHENLFEAEVVRAMSVNHSARSGGIKGFFFRFFVRYVVCSQ